MNQKIKHIAGTLFYSVSANALSTGISMLLVAIVPKALGVAEYGYWQLYTFYVSYVGFFHFGWADGIYLRNGGKLYDDLDKPAMHTQFWLLSAFELLVSVCVALFAVFFIKDSSKTFILIMVGFSCFITLPRTILQFLLQCTGRIKEYSTYTILEKIVYAVAVLALVLGGVRRFEYLLLSDAFAKVCSTVFIFWLCRDIVCGKAAAFTAGLRDAWHNVSIGIKLMFANVASMLIIGIVRFSIERRWDIATFGKISLSMTVSNLLMVFINAASMVMFPILKRTPQERWGANYSVMRGMLVVPILGALLAYYPARVVLSAWLPQYAEGLSYMALMFPICLYEGKMALLVNTYLKAMRREKTILFVNLSAVGLSVLATGISVYWLHSLPLAVVSIVVLLAFRCGAAELVLGRALNIRVLPDILLELFMTASFIGVSWFIGGWSGMLLYGVCYAVYLVIKRKELVSIVQMLKGT